ncbi:unnamed protein product [Callosobruchus maculatus]|uniref:Uncharacterized protein n=1 Tax=Callosobruchus maculatus TaxID=64391 RepID=A0A653BTV3_CALMS|nr:unnamed protein product [Callosobruchus maculatus]
MPKGPTMGTDSTGSSGDNRTKHNPDADNLKSLLKKTSKKDRSKQQNRVVFNETKNEFFDADYIILIREECCSGAGDYDDDDDDEDGGVCTCYQHEMVRLQTTPCCEPDCECYLEEEVEQTHRDQQRSPKFAPPMEFVDSVVTLSPPEGYKDLELDEHALAEYRQQQKLLARNKALLKQQQNMGRQAVCRECSASGDLGGDRDDRPQSNYEAIKSAQESRDESNNNEKIDQSQQTTPTSPNNTDGQNYSLDSIEDEKSDPPRALPNMGSPVSGILKGGRLWRQQSSEDGTKSNEFSKIDSASDEDGPNHRTVRFVEAEEKKDRCKGSPESEREIEGGEVNHKNPEDVQQDTDSETTAEPTEMMLTFKLGNHMLISNNSLKPNSAVRQLFPSAKPLADSTAQDDASDQYLVTAESLKAFEEAKRAKLPQIIHNDSIKRVIERNTLRRSLVRYEPRRKQTQKTDNSLVERIKQLTCDIDSEVGQQDSEELLARVSPTGEEQRSTAVDGNNQANRYKEPPRNFSPTSSSTTSSNSSMSSTYKKITDLFGKKDKPDSSPPVCLEPKTVQTQTLPDIGGPYINQQECNEKIIRPNPTTDSRKQFLSTLAPLTACVGNVTHPEGDYHYHLSTNNRQNHHQHQHQQVDSVTSSTESEYTLEDIDEGLNNEADGKKNVSTPDVLAGTPASESGDELVNFVQQDQNRIDRIKKKYENDQKKPASTNEDEEDENDDYGFNHRPSVRGIKPRFGSTTEILQQIQNQIQMPATNANTAAWYYSDDDANRVKHNQQQYNNVARQQYRPTSLHENYQNCASQTCYKEVYKTQSFIEMDCNDYQRMTKQLRNGRALSPPPQDISKNYHQTMVYIPYNHIEGYHPVAYQTNEYYRYNQNQINKKYIDTIYHHKMTTHMEEQYCNSNLPHIQKVTAITTKGPYPANYQHLAPSSRSESPLFGGTYSTARATQTAVGCIPSCNLYSVPPPTVRYRDGVRPQWKPEYATVDQMAANKAVNRHSFPIVRPKYPSDNPQDPMCLEDGQQQHNSFNGYYNYGMQNSPADSPTKARYIERGVPEGAASVSPQDSIVTASSSSVATSPTVPHAGNIAANPKPLFYAMNV